MNRSTKTLFSNRLLSESTEQQPENLIANVMNSRQDCPYCSGVALRHIHANSGEVYWRCGYCHQETPV